MELKQGDKVLFTFNGVRIVGIIEFLDGNLCVVNTNMIPRSFYMHRDNVVKL
jgi:hypothetical protein